MPGPGATTFVARKWHKHADTTAVRPCRTRPRPAAAPGRARPPRPAAGNRRRPDGGAAAETSLLPRLQRTGRRSCPARPGAEAVAVGYPRKVDLELLRPELA